MNVKGLHIFVIVVALMMAGEASGQDPDLQDSLIIGNLDGSVIPVGTNQEVVLPVWMKTDDSISFMHTPLGSDDDYIEMRLGGVTYEPLSLWDEISFLTPNPNSPSPGMTSQSILGFAYLIDPRDPQNFLYTNYEWWHVADFHMLTTSDTTVIGDTVCLVEGFNPASGGLLWGIPDGITQIIPAAIYPCLYFLENMFPVFTEPAPGSEFDVNNEFPVDFLVEATDADNDVISLTYDFPEDGVQFDTVNMVPGYSVFRFRWMPGVDDTGQFIATFTANDGHGGVVDHQVPINVTPAILQVEEISGFPCEEVTVPVNLINLGESSYIGGFDILLQYGIPEMIDLQSVQRGPRIDNWDYFNVNLGDTSSIRIVGLADVSGTGNGLPPGSGPVALLTFEITGDSVYVGHYAEINFIFGDENDNTLSDTSGYRLIHPAVDSGWVFIQDPYNVVIGDININGVPWEISDAVLLANHILTPDLFPFNQIQIIASDCNQDGVSATLPDLVYLLNVINGHITPPRINYENGQTANVYADPDGIQAGRLAFIYDSPLPAGGILIRLDYGDSEIGVPITSTGMTMLHENRDGILSVLLFDYEGGVIYPGQDIFEVDFSDESIPVVTELQVSDQHGNFIPSGGRPVLTIPQSFVLHGAYPNPFNSSTAIKFSLPGQADVSLSIYNVLGQAVKSIEYENMPAGEGVIAWDGISDDGGRVSSGVYLYRIIAGEYEATSRMTLLK
jgi:hypothetical protein